MDFVVNIKMLYPGVNMPEYKSIGASGVDLSAILYGFDFNNYVIPDGGVEVEPGAIIKIYTGISIRIPEGYEGQIRSRSGLAVNHGICVVNSPGTIDSDYSGELIVGLINLSKDYYSIDKYDRIAQLVFAPVARAEFCNVTELEKTVRGAGGFGSTGK